MLTTRANNCCGLGGLAPRNAVAVYISYSLNLNKSILVAEIASYLMEVWVTNKLGCIWFELWRRKVGGLRYGVSSISHCKIVAGEER